MKHKIKRLLSLLLSLTMLTAALPAPAWAEESGLAQATGAEAELPNEPELPSEPPEVTASRSFPRADGYSDQNVRKYGTANSAGYGRPPANA